MHSANEHIAITVGKGLRQKHSCSVLEGCLN